jgi:ketosteroid isomerase-like protein
MKRILAFGLVASVVVGWISASHALSADEQTDAAVKDALVQVEHQWGDAMVKGDVAAFGRCIADDWILTWSDGSLVTKSMALADLKEGALKIESLRFDDVRVRVYGDTAIVTGMVTEQSKFRERDTSGKRRFTDVFLKRDGHWQAVASHECDVLEKK